MRKKILLFFCAILVFLTTYAQMLTVKGKVLDEKGQPVAGVTISAKKSKKGLTISGDDGNFTASLSSGD